MIFPPYTRPAETVLDLIADFMLIGAGTGILAFTLLYLLFFNWRETPSGKAILYFTCSLGLLLALVIASKLFGGDYFGREVLRILVYGLNFLTAWGLVLTLIRSWTRGEKPLDLVERESMRRNTGPADIQHAPIDHDD